MIKKHFFSTYLLLAFAITITVVHGTVTHDLVVHEEGKKTHSPFIIAQSTKKRQSASRNSLKEDIGDELTKLLKISSALHESLGSLQMEIARMQKSFIATGSALINNKTPLRKAHKKDLHVGLNALQSASGALGTCKQQVIDIEKSMQGVVILADK